MIMLISDVVMMTLYIGGMVSFCIYGFFMFCSLFNNYYFFGENVTFSVISVMVMLSPCVINTVTLSKGWEVRRW